MSAEINFVTNQAAPKQNTAGASPKPAVPTVVSMSVNIAIATTN